MAIVTARNTFLGLGGESTYGTDGTVDRWFFAESVDVVETLEVVSQPSMFQSTGAAGDRYSAPGPNTVDISMVLLPSYTGFGTVLVAALGAHSTTGAGPYVHLYKLAAADASSDTLEIPDGDSGNADTYTGWQCSMTEFSVEAGSKTYMRVSLKGIAQKWLSRTTTSTPTFTGAGVPTPVLYYQSGNLAFNSANYLPKSFKLTIDHGYSRVDVLGSQNTVQPVKDKRGSYTASMVLEFTDTQFAALMVAHRAQTESDLTYTFTSGSNSMLFTLHNAKIVSVGRPLAGAGRVSVSVTWKGFSDGTDDGVSVTVTNAQSSGLAV